VSRASSAPPESAPPLLPIALRPAGPPSSRIFSSCCPHRCTCGCRLLRPQQTQAGEPAIRWRGACARLPTHPAPSSLLLLHHDAPQGPRRQAPAHRPGLRLVQAPEAKGVLAYFHLRLRPPPVWISSRGHRGLPVPRVPRNPTLSPFRRPVSGWPGSEAYNTCTPDLSDVSVTRRQISFLLPSPSGLPSSGCTPAMLLGARGEMPASDQADTPGRRRVHPPATKHKAVGGKWAPRSSGTSVPCPLPPSPDLNRRRQWTTHGLDSRMASGLDTDTAAPGYFRTGGRLLAVLSLLSLKSFLERPSRFHAVQVLMTCILADTSRPVQWHETLPNLSQEEVDVLLHAEQRFRPCCGLCCVTNEAAPLGHVSAFHPLRLRGIRRIISSSPRHHASLGPDAEERAAAGGLVHVGDGSTAAALHARPGPCSTTFIPQLQEAAEP
jgi:hypothetical protein